MNSNAILETEVPGAMSFTQNLGNKMANASANDEKNYPKDDHRWNAVIARDPACDGQFVFGVSSTGVYCRPSCPARRPRRENVRFFLLPEEAEKVGYRA